MNKKTLFPSLLLFIFTLALALTTAAAIPPKPAENTFIFDYAGMLSTPQQDQLRALGKALHDASNAELVLVTVESLSGAVLEDYAHQLFREWGIGDAQKNNGVLLLVNQENVLTNKAGRVRIEVGYGLEGALPDGKCGRILDDLTLTAWARKEYDKGVYDCYLALGRVIAEEYQLDIKAEALAPLAMSPSYKNHNDADAYTLFKLIFFPLVILIFFLHTTLGRRTVIRSGGGFGGGGFGGGGGFRGGGFGGGRSGGGGASR